MLRSAIDDCANLSEGSEGKNHSTRLFLVTKFFDHAL